MSAPTGRQWSGPADLARMQAALSRSWRVRRPFVSMTVGDLEWWIASAQPGTDLTTRVRVWPDPDDDGSVLAFGWCNPPNALDCHQRADLLPDVRAALVDETLAWAAGWARDAAGASGIDPPEVLETWALDDDAELASILRARGWQPAGQAGYSHFHRRLDVADPSIPTPVVPDGYRLRPVHMPDDIEARVEVHRAAFAPSRMTVEKYRTLIALPHYAPERDLVAEAPDGSFAAFTMAWLDPVGRVGELEPVGTHPDHRRLGLARAVNLAALHVLCDRGALDAVVLSATSNEASEALYAAVGFERVSWHRAWTHPIG